MKRRDGLTMPEVRALIREMRETLDKIEARLIRRSPTKRAKPTSARMTAKMREAIRQMAADHPDMAMSEIAASLNVNQGRVSEVLAEPRNGNHTERVDETPLLPMDILR
jgi:hypothetical protein